MIATAWALAWGLGLTAAVRGAVISEIAPSGGAGQPAYIEITLEQTPASMQLLVLDATSISQRTVRSDSRFAIEPFTRVVVVHEGAWVGPAPARTQLVPVADLKLGGQFIGAARRLVVFDTSDGRNADQPLPYLDQWDADPAMPARLDAATFTINGWSYDALLGEPVTPIAPGGAAARINAIGRGFTDTFAAGPLSPGLVNTAVHLPEPAGLTALAIGAIVLLPRRRPRRPHDPRRTALLPR